MALPYSFAAGLTWSDWRSGHHGPFESGGNLYAALIDDTNGHVEIWKSTDGGDSWAEQDSANHKVIDDNDQAGWRTLYAIQSGTTLYVSYWTGISTDGQYVVSPFSMATDTWGTTTGTGESTINNASDSLTSTPAIMLARRSDGDYVVFAQGNDQSVMGTAYRRVTYHRHEGSTWTENVDVGGIGSQIHYDARAIAMDASDVAYLFYTDTTNSDLLCKTLNSSNSLSSASTIDATANVGNYNAGHAAIIDTTTDQVIIPYVDSTGDLVLAYSDVGTSPSWSFQTITTTNDPEYTNGNPASVALDGTTVHVFWPNDADQDIYRDSGTTGSGFTTDTEWKDAVTCNGISIGKLTSGIGILYFDGTTVKYDAYGAATNATGTVSAGSLTVSGQSITGRAGSLAMVATGSHTVSGQSIAGTVGDDGTVATGSHTVAGQSITARGASLGTVATGSHTVTAQSITANPHALGSIANGAHTVSGQAIAAVAGSVGAVASGAHAVSGQSIAGRSASLGTIGTGSHTVAGQAISAGVAADGTVATGTHTVSGQALAAMAGSVGAVANGAHAVTGQTITALAASLGTVATGSHAVTGQNITADPHALGTVANGAHAVTGQSITGRAASLGSVATGSHVITGQSISGIAGSLGTIGTGSHAITGQSISGTEGAVSDTGTVATGELVVSGQSISGRAGAMGRIVPYFEAQPSLNNTVQFGLDSILPLEVAQSFTLTSPQELYRIRCAIFYVGTFSDGIVCDIQTDAAGEPSGTVLATSEVITAVPAFSGAFRYFRFSGVSLSASTTYWIVMRRTNPSATGGNFGVWAHTASGYAGQMLQYESGAWSVTGTYNLTTYDMTFELSGPIMSVSGQSISARYGSVGVIASGDLLISGQTVIGVAGTLASLTSGELAIIGQAIAAQAGTLGTVDSGLLAASAQVITATGGTVAVIVSGVHAVDGQSITATELSADVTGTIATGAYTVTGGVILADWSMVHYIVTKQAGSYTVTKPADALTVAKGSTAFSVTKQADGYSVAKSAGTYIVTKEN